MSTETLPGDFRPYKVGRILRVPGARPYIFEIVAGSQALFEVGILAELASIFAREGIPILQLKTSAAALKEKTRILLTADLKGRERDAPRLAESLRKVRSVERVEYAPPLFDGVVADVWSHPLLLDEERVALLSQPFFAGMLRRGWSEFGTPFAAILYHVSFAGAVEQCKRLFELYGKENGLKLAIEYFMAQGHGVLRIDRLTAREMVAKVYDSFECSVQRGAGAPRGAFVRGIVAGIAAAHWGASPEEIEVDEVKCLAKGDPYCEYVVKRR